MKHVWICFQLVKYEGGKLLGIFDEHDQAAHLEEEWNRTKHPDDYYFAKFEVPMNQALGNGSIQI